MPHLVTIVVPCFNEARRFAGENFAPLLHEGAMRLLFVDDGSTDETYERVRAYTDQTKGKAEVLKLAANQGKAEAVRSGLNQAIQSGSTVVGYLDADGSTPGEEMLRLWQAFASTQVDVLLGARVGLMGTHIERRPWRHYVGRGFATAASLILGLRVYDTQCGAKLFRVTALLRRALQHPFMSRWLFDVELLLRLTRGVAEEPPLDPSSIVEIPLQTWRDVAGSKLRLSSAPQILLELTRIAREAQRMNPHP